MIDPAKFEFLSLNMTEASAHAVAARERVRDAEQAAENARMEAAAATAAWREYVSHAAGLEESLDVVSLVA